MDNQTFRVDDIYVPTKRPGILNQAKVNSIAENLLEEGRQRTPILVGRDGERFVLVEGFKKLGVCSSLGKETVVGMVVRARRK